MSPAIRQPAHAAKRKFCLVTTSALIVEFFLIPHLRRLTQRFDVTLIANEDCATLLARERVAGVRAVTIPLRRDISPLNDLRSLVRLAGFFRREQFAAVVTVAPKTGLIGMIAAALVRIPVRCHIFQGEVWATRHGLSRWALRWTDRLVAAVATHILVVSKSERDFLVSERVLPADRGAVLGSGSICGVDTQEFRPDPGARNQTRSVLGVSEQALVVLYLGRIKRDKGVLDLVHAWSALAPRYPELHLVIVGPDEDGLGPEFLRIASADVAARLHVQGHTIEPADWIAAADILSLPSYREGFGMVLIEAAAMGLPVVASRIYGASDAMVEGVTGLAHAPGDVGALQQALERLVQDPELRYRLGQAGRTRVLREFEQEAVVGRYIDLWDSIVPKPGA